MKRIQFITGGQTAAVRRDYKLDKILSDSLEEVHKKNRKDPRHHMLDALVISFLAEKFRKLDKRNLMKLPDGVTQDYFRKEIEAHVPIQINAKAIIEDNFYGMLKERKKVFQRALIYPTKKEDGDKFTWDKFKKKMQGGEILCNDQMRLYLNNLIENIRSADDWNQWRKFAVSPSGAKLKNFKIISNYTECYSPSKARGSTGNQLICSKTGYGVNHPAYIVFQDDHNKWKIRPIYAHQGVFNGLKEFGRPYRNLLYRGDVINLDAFDDLIAGRYVVMGARLSGQITIILAKKPTVQILKPIGKLVEQGRFSVIPRDHL